MHSLAQTPALSGSSTRVLTFAILKNLAIFSLLFAAATLPAFAQQVTACGSGSISIPNFGPAAPYPYPISVSGLTGNVSKLTVTITGFNQSFPDDVDMLLVSPDGTRKMVVWSDVGGSIDAVNLNITLDDDAASTMPDAGPLSSGSYKPANVFNGITDVFPAPAPAGPYSDPAPTGAATFASVFNGMTPAQANGVWNLYISDDSFNDSGSISGSVCLNITPASAPPPAGALTISEFRLRGPNGANDEFIEIYNASGANHSVAATSGSGYGVAASDGIVRCTIPNGTVIPARGHYLCVNSAGYSLTGYPAGNGTTATGDATYTTDIPDNAGIALFNNNLPANFTLANRIDAVGSSSEANTLYKEGAGYPAIATSTVQQSFYRDLTTGLPKDTDNNAADFLYVDTFGLATAAGTHLGAPGPENLSSPIQRNGWLTPSLIDPTVSASLPPNRVRDQTKVTNGGFGTIDIRRRYTNNTGAPVTRLRFRIVEMTTYYTPGMADLRAISSGPIPVTVNSAATCAPGAAPCSITVEGTTLEHPAGPNLGGGLNSTLSAETVTLATPLANGQSINVRWLLGVAGKGNFSFYVNIEMLP